MKKCILVLALCAGLTAAAGAADKRADEILKKMDAAEKNIKTIVFDFSQEIVYTLTNERQLMRGSVSCVLPDNLLVRQNSPLRQDIISNGKKVWVYTPEYRQVLVDNFKRWSKNNILPPSLLTVGRTADEIRRKYTVTVISEEGDTAILALDPHKKDIWRMKLWVDLQTFLLQRAVFDGDNVTVSLTISDYRLNTPLDAGMFSFAAPAGVEEIKIP